MSRTRTPGDGPKCGCGAPAVWGGYCQMEDGRGFCSRGMAPREGKLSPDRALARVTAEQKPEAGEVIEFERDHKNGRFRYRLLTNCRGNVERGEFYATHRSDDATADDLAAAGYVSASSLVAAETKADAYERAAAAQARTLSEALLELASERAGREHLEQAAELLRGCCKRNFELPDQWTQEQIDALNDRIHAWHKRDQASAPAPPSEGKLTCDRCKRPYPGRLNGPCPRCDLGILRSQPTPTCSTCDGKGTICDVGAQGGPTVPCPDCADVRHAVDGVRSQPTPTCTCAGDSFEKLMAGGGHGSDCSLRNRPTPTGEDIPEHVPLDLSVKEQGKHPPASPPASAADGEKPSGWLSFVPGQRVRPVSKGAFREGQECSVICSMVHVKFPDGHITSYGPANLQPVDSALPQPPPTEAPRSERPDYITRQELAALFRSIGAVGAANQCADGTFGPVGRAKP